MRLRPYLGKNVQITYRDPVERTCEVKTKDGSDIPRGMAALAKRRERGILDDITDGVARICHWDVLRDDGDGIEEGAFSWVPEDLVVDVKVEGGQRDGTEMPVGSPEPRLS